MELTRCEICARCRKVSHDAVSVKSKTRYNTFYRLCRACLGSSVTRRRRIHEESPVERELRKELTNERLGVPVLFEYSISGSRFIFDIAVPRLRLLIELDSPSYHRYPRQLKRDKAKTEEARRLGWDLVRIKTTEPQLTFLVVQTIKFKDGQLG